ncbi:NADH dehydrogenase [ubiquinone] 1 alpha subcomplex subunit 5 isoform X2 [Ranitomeya imitator]|uniref:NADH dehydrogenase [ubiquinone] 1 alpha subcomplex subunit 5 isoform X2 n=1 Tax=Ranitomeya imitator TaxID=111125 RepID=UPI0037E9BC51
MAGVLKKTTGLVGLAVSPNPHDRLRILYTKILAALQTIPKDAAYRKYTEQIVNDRFSAVKTAENELYLVRKMSAWKPWEPLVEEPPADQWKWPI